MTELRELCRKKAVVGAYLHNRRARRERHPRTHMACVVGPVCTRYRRVRRRIRVFSLDIAFFGSSDRAELNMPAISAEVADQRIHAIGLGLVDLRYERISHGVHAEIDDLRQRRASTGHAVRSKHHVSLFRPTTAARTVAGMGVILRICLHRKAQLRAVPLNRAVESLFDAHERLVAEEITCAGDVRHAARIASGATRVEPHRPSEISGMRDVCNQFPNAKFTSRTDVDDTAACEPLGGEHQPSSDIVNEQKVPRRRSIAPHEQLRVSQTLHDGRGNHMAVRRIERVSRAICVRAKYDGEAETILPLVQISDKCEIALHPSRTSARRAWQTVKKRLLTQRYRRVGPISKQIADRNEPLYTTRSRGFDHVQVNQRRVPVLARWPVSTVLDAPGDRREMDEDMHAFGDAECVLEHAEIVLRGARHNHIVTWDAADAH